MSNSKHILLAAALCVALSACAVAPGDAGYGYGTTYQDGYYYPGYVGWGGYAGYGYGGGYGGWHHGWEHGSWHGSGHGSRAGHRSAAWHGHSGHAAHHGSGRTRH